MLETFCHTGDEGTFLEMMSELYEMKINWLGSLSSEIFDTQKDVFIHPSFANILSTGDSWEVFVEDMCKEHFIE